MALDSVEMTCASLFDNPFIPVPIGVLYSPRNDPDPEMIPNPEMIPIFLLVDPEMIPKELWNGDETWDCGLLNNLGK